MIPRLKKRTEDDDGDAAWLPPPDEDEERLEVQDLVNELTINGSDTDGYDD